VFDPAPEGGGSIVIPQTGAELKAWMSRVRSHKCLVGVGCSGPVEFAHLEAVPSANFYGFLSRRQGLGMWPGVPLCREHHREGRDAIHEIGEAAFVEKHLGGYKRAFGWIIGQMAAFILELRQPQ
jgi:hypothetical protein